MNVSMYEVALRKKLRFQSPRGELSLEMLWDVPLTSKDDFNLDQVAKAVNHALKEITEESFVSTRKSPRQTELELKLELVKHVIDVKLQEVERAEQRAENQREKQRLLAALADKQESKYAAMSEATLKKKLKELEA